MNGGFEGEANGLVAVNSSIASNAVSTALDGEFGVFCWFNLRQWAFDFHQWRPLRPLLRD